MAPYNFDDSNIKWNKLTLPPVGELKHLLFSILSVDEESHIVHVLFKFAANEKIILHRHMIQNNTFVVQGEHRLYDRTARSRRFVPQACTNPAHRAMSIAKAAAQTRTLSCFSTCGAARTCSMKSSTMTRMSSPRSVTPTSSVLIKRNRVLHKR
jgi:hypothetical protein